MGARRPRGAGGRGRFAGVVYPPETQYRTTGIVGVDPLATSANDRVDFLRNLRAAASSRAVLEDVSQETDLPVARLKDGLELQRIGDSNLTRVVYVSDSDDADTARAVVLGVVSASQEFLHEASREELAARADEATDRLRDAELALRDVETRIQDAVRDNDGIPPDVEFDAMQRQLADLRLRRVTTNAAEDPAIATQLDDAIAGLEQQLPTVASAAADTAGCSRNRTWPPPGWPRSSRGPRTPRKPCAHRGACRTWSSSRSPNRWTGSTPSCGRWW